MAQPYRTPRSVAVTVRGTTCPSTSWVRIGRPYTSLTRSAVSVARGAPTATSRPPVLVGCEHHDAVAVGGGQVEVVHDDERGRTPSTARRTTDMTCSLIVRVHRRSRLIEQPDRRPLRQDACQRDAPARLRTDSRSCAGANPSHRRRSSPRPRRHRRRGADQLRAQAWRAICTTSAGERESDGVLLRPKPRRRACLEHRHLRDRLAHQLNAPQRFQRCPRWPTPA